MGYCGSPRPERRGATCPIGMAPGIALPVASTAGVVRACGIDCWLPYSTRQMSLEVSIGQRTSWMARSCAPISMQAGRESVREGRPGRRSDGVVAALAPSFIGELNVVASQSSSC